MNTMKKIWLIAALLIAGFLTSTTTSPARQEGKNELQIVEAKLGKDVKERMIVEEDSAFTKNSKIFLWMKITGGASDQITVTWKNGEYSHNTTLMVGGSPWRTWASKTVAKAGDWTVSVTDSSGKVLKEISFKVE